MEFNSFSPIPEDEDELHLPELVYWSSLGDAEEVQILLNNGADPNTSDEEGYSALHAAAENGHLAVVKILVDHGADVGFKSEYTALELAQMTGQQSIIDYLKKLS